MKSAGRGKKTYGSVCHEHGVRKASSEPGDTMFGESLLVKHATNEDLGGRVDSTLLGPQARRHERLFLGVPSVGIVDSEHSSEADDKACRLVCLQRKGK